MGFLELLLTLLVAAIIGWLADLIVPGTLPWGSLGAIVAGLIGALIGSALLGDVGPTLGRLAILPALVGAIIFAFLINLLLKATVRRPT